MGNKCHGCGYNVHDEEKSLKPYKMTRAAIAQLLPSHLDKAVKFYEYWARQIEELEVSLKSNCRICLCIKLHFLS
jgi:hypothetical protein